MTPPDETAPPTLIGNRYRLEERIGAGAMGVVWRGTDELLNRTVAVKELLAAAEPGAGGGGVEESRQRILREGRIGARLQHAHVISMFDVVVHDDRPWLVMEYLPSRSLAALLAEGGTMDPREAAAVGRQVADGLVAAHAAGVVHRDVKPGNVLIAEDGRVKLTDFGVSRAVDDVQLTRTGLIAGTPAFLAPEVARGREPTAASDVFALGATLYAAVEGRPPFGLEENAYALLHKVATGEVDPPSHAGPLTALLMRLLDPEPSARPTAKQARDALAAIADGRVGAAPSERAGSGTAILAAPVLGSRAAPAAAADGADGAAPAVAPAAPTPPPRPAAQSRPGRLPMPVLLGVLVLVLAAVGAGFAVWSSGSGSGESPPAAAAPLPPSPSPSPSAAPTTEQAPSPTPSPDPEPSPEPESADEATPPAAPGNPVAFVQNYYSLLPGNTEAAWQLLSPAAQSASGGRGGFENFYAGMESVTVQDVRATGEGTVDATVVFVERGGRTSSEPYRFVVSTENGRQILASFSRV
jgi:hypothetical protein